MSYVLSANEKSKLQTMLQEYFQQHLTQTQLNGDTQRGLSLQKQFRQNFLEGGLSDDSKFMNFLLKDIWAIEQSVRLGLPGQIKAANTVEELREGFKSLLERAPKIADRGQAVHLISLPYVATGILSEVLSKAYPSQFAIKNKRSETALRFILDATPQTIEAMSYGDFMDVSQQVGAALAEKLRQIDLSFDGTLSYWYVDRFFDWIYERPKTKVILGPHR